MNRKRVQTLRDVIAGIPAKRFDLDFVFKGDETGTQRGAPNPCGAIACIAGWAWIYPPFVKAGIRKQGTVWPADAAPHFFKTSASVFWSRQRGEDGTDKEVALRRLDRLLKSPY